jgi:phage tail-like protein
MASKDPALGFRFGVEIGGVVEAIFTECSGLSLERKVFQYEEGGVNDHVHMLPGRTKGSNIVLKYGVTESNSLWKWYQAGLYDGNVKTVNVSIILFDSEGKELKRWNADGAYPVKWKGPDFNAANSQVAIETIELAHQGLSLG